MINIITQLYVLFFLVLVVACAAFKDAEKLRLEQPKLSTKQPTPTLDPRPSWFRKYFDNVGKKDSRSTTQRPSHDERFNLTSSNNTTRSYNHAADWSKWNPFPIHKKPTNSTGHHTLPENIAQNNTHHINNQQPPKKHTPDPRQHPILWPSPSPITKPSDNPLGNDNSSDTTAIKNEKNGTVDDQQDAFDDNDFEYSQKNFLIPNMSQVACNPLPKFKVCVSDCQDAERKDFMSQMKSFCVYIYKYRYIRLDIYV